MPLTSTGWMSRSAFSHLTNSDIITGTSTAVGGGVDQLAGGGVDHIVLDAPVLARGGTAAAHSFDQLVVDLADHPLGDWIPAVQALGDELEGDAVVEQLPRIVRIGLGYGFALPEPLGLFQGQPGACDVGGVMRLINACSPTSRTQSAESCAASRKPRARSMLVIAAAMRLVMMNLGRN